MVRLKDKRQEAVAGMQKYISIPYGAIKSE